MSLGLAASCMEAHVRHRGLAPHSEGKGGGEERVTCVKWLVQHALLLVNKVM